MGTRPDFKRLGAAVLNRRVELGMKTREEFSANVDVSYRALSDLENGKRAFSQSTYALVEQALFWKPGSCARVLAGGEPDAVPLSLTPLGLDEAGARLVSVALQARLEELGLTAEDASSRSGLAAGIWEHLLSAKPAVVQRTVTSRLERYLQWTPGSLHRVAMGGEPMRMEDAAETSLSVEPEHLELPSDELEADRVPLGDEDPDASTRREQLLYLAKVVGLLSAELNQAAQKHKDLEDSADLSNTAARYALVVALAEADESEATEVMAVTQAWIASQGSKVPATKGGAWGSLNQAMEAVVDGMPPEFRSRINLDDVLHRG